MPVPRSKLKTANMPASTPKARHTVIQCITRVMSRGFVILRAKSGSSELS